MNCPSEIPLIRDTYKRYRHDFHIHNKVDPPDEEQSGVNVGRGFEMFSTLRLLCKVVKV
jgi:hypothetical protein